MQLRKHHLANHIHVVRDGAEALDFVFARAAYAGRYVDLPAKVILLDIKLPKVDGLEVLRRLRAADKTRNIPVIILSNYDEQDLVARGLHLGAHEYLIKARTTPSSLSEGIEDWLKE